MIYLLTSDMFRDIVIGSVRRLKVTLRGDCGCDNTQVRESFAHFLLTLFPCAGTCSCDCDKQQDALAWKKTDSIQCETSMASIE